MTAIITTGISLYMNNKNINEDSNDTLSNLKLISTVKENEKIHVKSLSIRPVNVFTAVERWFQREDKHLTRNFIQNTITRTFDIIGSRLTDKKFCSNVITDLILSTVGIKNIQYTYKEERDFCCKLDTLIQRIEEKLIEYNYKVPDIFKNLDKNITDILNTIIKND